MNQNDPLPSMQSYPSPTTVAADSGAPFYNSSSAHHPRLPSPGAMQMAADLSRGIASALHEHPQSPTSHPNPYSTEHPLGARVNHSPSDHAHTSYHGTLQLSQEEPIERREARLDNHGSIAPRKRTKVSRACDECRRKKIRCDATSDAGDEQCTSCRKTQTTCQFSRVPMKRGPSRGYIKELADRLSSLEGAVQAGEIPQYATIHHDDASPHNADELSPPPPNSAGGSRKRAYSTLSNDLSAAFITPQKTVGWAQEMARHLPSLSSSLPNPQGEPTGARYTSHYSPNGMAPQPVWRTSPDTLRRPSGSFEALTNIEYGDGTAQECDMAIIDLYYKIIHPTFPILPSERAHITCKLADMPLILREALFEALHLVVQSYSLPGSQHHETSSSRKALDLIAQSLFDTPSTRTFSANIVYLQAILLMTVRAEGNPTISAHPSPGPPRSMWLGSAVGLAYHMKLHIVNKADDILAGDVDTDAKIARRLWWSLVIMDRWHASSTASPLMIPETSVVLLPEDQNLLGDELYHLARLTSVLGHLAIVFGASPDVMAPNSTTGSIIGTLLVGELERFRESFPSTLSLASSPLVHLCYWHIKLLMKRLVPTSAPIDLIGPASQLAAILTSNVELITPLHHHFVTLAALTLTELSEHDTTRAEAEKLLAMLVETGNVLFGWDNESRALIFKRAQPLQVAPPVSSSTTEQTTSQGLQRLADLATATEQGRTEETSTEVQNPVTIASTGTVSTNPAVPSKIPNVESKETVAKSKPLSPAGALSERASHVDPRDSSNKAPSQTKSWDPSSIMRQGYMNTLSEKSVAQSH